MAWQLAAYSYRESEKKVKALLEAGAKADGDDLEGNTAQLAAVSKDDGRIADVLFGSSNCELDNEPRYWTPCETFGSVTLVL